MSIEDRVDKLNSIVCELESDDVDLDKAVKKYGEAVKIAAKTMEELKKAENAILVLKKEGSKIIEEKIELE